MYSNKHIEKGHWSITSSNQRHEDQKSSLLNILRDNNVLKEIFLQQYGNKKMYQMDNPNKKYMKILQININMIETYSVMTIKKHY